MFDYDGDGKGDIFLGDADGKGNAALYQNLGGGKFRDVTKEAKLEMRGALACAVGDYDNDGHPDLAVSFGDRIALYHNEANGTFADVTEEVGIHSDAAAATARIPHDVPEGSTPATFPGPAYDTGPDAPLVLGLTFIDFDHDGDLDLYVTRFRRFPLKDTSQPFAFPQDAKGPGNVLWRNNGNGTFTEWTKEAGLEGNGPSIGAIGSDVNNDRAIDFVVTGVQKNPIAMMNHLRDPQAGIFRSPKLWTSEMPGSTAGVVSLDFDKDGWMGLAFTHWAPPGLSVWRNVRENRSSAWRCPIWDGYAAGESCRFDYDNDGWIDLVAVGETFSGEGRIELLRNEGPAASAM